MQDLRLFFFGAPHVVCDGQALHVDTRKATALLAYLAMKGRPCRRETLVAMLWPNSDSEHGRGVLRRTLFALNKALNGSGLVADRETIGLSADTWCDVNEFHRLLMAQRDETPLTRLGRLAEAVALYRDDFLNGFGLEDSLEFDDWQVGQAEQLRCEMGEALERLVKGYTALGQMETALGIARRWLALDPLNEAAHRQIMCLHAWLGQRTAALQQYTACQTILRAQIGVEPQAETTRLYAAIKENRLLEIPTSSWLASTQHFMGLHGSVQPAAEEQLQGPGEPNQGSKNMTLNPIHHWWWHLG